MYEPIVITPNGDDRFLILSGHRRVAAHRLLVDQGKSEFTTIPAIIQNELDEDKSEETLIDANLFTEPLTPAELAKELARKKELLEKRRANGENIPGKLTEIIATELGIAPKTARELDTINRRAEPEIKELFENGEISQREAFLASRHTLEEQQKLSEQKKKGAQHLFPKKGEDNDTGVAYAPPLMDENNDTGVAYAPPLMDENNDTGVAYAPPLMDENNDTGVAYAPPLMDENNDTGVAYAPPLEEPTQLTIEGENEAPATTERPVRQLRTHHITAQEASIEYGGISYLCAFGKHVNGGWIAILNFGVSAELSASRYDVKHNARKIREALMISEDSWLPKEEELFVAAQYIAEVVTEMIGGM